MGQTAPANQALLWTIAQRGQETSVDRDRAYVLVALLKRELKIERSLYEILQILSVASLRKPLNYQAF